MNVVSVLSTSLRCWWLVCAVCVQDVETDEEEESPVTVYPMTPSRWVGQISVFIALGGWGR